MTKIVELDQLAEILEKKRHDGFKIVHCHGVFDLLHIGHIRYLEESKSMGNILVVTITPDEFVSRGPGRPAFSQDLRAEAIAALGAVDFVSINRWATAVETIKCLKPDFYVKGPDYKDHRNDVTGNIKQEEDAILSVGGEIKYTDNITFSSSRLINQHLLQFTEQQKIYLDNLKAKYSIRDILGYFDRISELNILVIGEVILDQYVYCDALGKSGKEPVLIMQKLDSEMYAGGVLAVGNHASHFANNIAILSYLGEKNEYEDFIVKSLPDNTKLDFIRKSDSPTIVKTRFVESYSKSKQLGVYEINDELINDSEESEFCAKLEDNIKEYNLIIVADYGHGLITSKVVDILIKKSKYLAVNTQINAANIGYHTISKYKQANYVCIHEGELRQEYRSRTHDIRELTRRLHKDLKCDITVITRGSNGALSYSDEEGFIDCPAFAKKIVDRVGAGDTLLAITSLCVAVGMPMDLSLFIGNLAGAHAVSKMGTDKPLTKVHLTKTIETMLK